MFSVFQDIEQTILDLKIESIAVDRIQVLDSLASYMQHKLDKKEAIRLNFICTHNSRRSHLGQIWAQTMAAYYHIPQVHGYSGGTEATAVYPQVLETLSEQGFIVKKESKGDNPVYAIHFGEQAKAIKAFSKVYNHQVNPTKDFAAVMTCSEADEACPFIPGAEFRVKLNYQDPKAFDHSSEQTAKYLERSVQIATEMKYLFQRLKSI